MQRSLEKIKTPNTSKGITLIALVITIIILLILAGVAINMAINSNGLFGKANEAVTNWNTAMGKDEQDINRLMDILNNNGKQNNHDYVKNGDKITCNHCGEEYTIGVSVVDYQFDLPEKDVVLTAEKSGADSDQTIFQAGSDDTTYTNVTWVVLGVADEDKDGTNESLLITSSTPVGAIKFDGPEGYLYGPEELERICRELYSSKNVEARSIVMEDINNAFSYISPGGIYVDKDYNPIATGDDIVKIKDIEVWDILKSNGTYTPDGVNSESALGEIVIDGYGFYISNDENGKLTACDYLNNDYSLADIPNTTELLLGNANIGYYGQAYYWIATAGTEVTGWETNKGPYYYASYGLYSLRSSMEEFSIGQDMFVALDSRETPWNDDNIGEYPIRPVVSIKDVTTSNKCYIHSYIKVGQKVKCKNCEIEYTIGLSKVKYDFGLPTDDVYIWIEETDRWEQVYECDSSDTTYTDVEWVVLGMSDENKDGENESLLITSVTPIGKIEFEEEEGFQYGPDVLNRLCDEIYTSFSGKARNMNVIDVFNAFGITNPTGTFTYGPEEKSTEVKLGTTLSDIEKQALISNVPEQLKEKLAGSFFLSFFAEDFSLHYKGLEDWMDCSNSDLKYAGLMINAGRDGEEYIEGSALASSMVTSYRFSNSRLLWRVVNLA